MHDQSNQVLTVDKVANELRLNMLTDVYENREVRTGYCCDMLSWVISKLESTACWFTILNSMNVIAVASISDCPLVVITESDGQIDPNVILKAGEERVSVCSTPMNSYEAACALNDLLNKSLGD